MSFNSKYEGAEVEALLDRAGSYAEVMHSADDAILSIEPNVFHLWGEISALGLTFTEGMESVVNEYVFQFTSGATPTILTLPDTIQWVNGAPSIEANKTYQVSIVNNIGLIVGV